jgi:hypothetical protein
MLSTEVTSPKDRGLTGPELFALFGGAVGVAGVVYFVTRYLHLHPDAPQEALEKFAKVLNGATQAQEITDDRNVYERSTQNYRTLID